MVWQEKYRVYNGFVDGHAYIQEDVPSGEYALIAHTPLSVHPEEPDIKSFRKIQVFKSILDLKKEGATPTAMVTDSLDVQLLPEGGYLVNGIRGKVAFKAVDRGGMPVAITGTLFENGKPLMEIRSLHAGMGSFYFIPFAGNAYYLQLKNSEVKYALPEIKNSGVMLQLAAQQKDTLQFRVVQSGELPPQKMYVLLQQRGMVYSLAEFSLKHQVLVKLPVSDLQQGIAEVTLFNEEMQPLAEWLVFVQEGSKL